MKTLIFCINFNVFFFCFHYCENDRIFIENSQADYLFIKNVEFLTPASFISHSMSGQGNGKLGK